MRSVLPPRIRPSGAISVPMYCSEAQTVSMKTDCVSTRMYQPRMMTSISNAHDVARSAGHW